MFNFFFNEPELTYRLYVLDKMTHEENNLRIKYESLCKYIDNLYKDMDRISDEPIIEQYMVFIDEKYKEMKLAHEEWINYLKQKPFFHNCPNK